MATLIWPRVKNQLAKRRATFVRHVRRARTSRTLHREVPEGARLHLGCGTVYLDGWLNIDVGRHSVADLWVDLRGGLPTLPGVISRIYHEHLLEHFSLEDGQLLLNDSFVALRPGGVLRIAMPDLHRMVTAYLCDWRNQEWVNRDEYSFIQTPAEMLNVGMRNWGHRHVYDVEDLTIRLRHAGFNDIRSCQWGESEVDDLRGLETRADSLLIVEAVR